MEAWIEKSGDVVVVHLKGRVDYETGEPFRNHCIRHLNGEKVVFNLKELSFVGSIGITDFVATMTELASQNILGIKFSGMGNEFRRVFEASGITQLEVYESTDRALLAHQGIEVAPLPRLSVVEPTELDSEEIPPDVNSPGAGS